MTMNSLRAAATDRTTRRLGVGGHKDVKRMEAWDHFVNAHSWGNRQQSRFRHTLRYRIAFLTVPVHQKAGRAKFSGAYHQVDEWIKKLLAGEPPNKRPPATTIQLRLLEEAESYEAAER